MFITPYMRKIERVLSRIWYGHEDDIFWEPEGVIGELAHKLSAELVKCHDPEYSNSVYVTGPADEWVAEVRAKHYLV